MNEEKITPTEITRSGEHDVSITWKDGVTVVYGARQLRLACACASCVEEMTGAALLAPESVPENVHPLQITAVGRYAIQIAFSDGHNTGIYSFDRLRELADRQ
ncbi:MAG: DUF971 domain-containing protein [Candidatus Krumholzibacteria bacterium]|jgi:ATP-binding protein involved in chromosome partitioning|nr:DUF971 domain-containing protein [Candidatus Krumholzibacteria bacterium]MDP6669603.1 DUF971 domain-containing protein [Candidatus Krumholzibacteria bacterium]MDP6798145.1 DUF971 domain-containing protein [Candidatus Krumholzibacteria bacterium]MDP7022008.1 DUF971 domain-containing protein [Candidatus Krumholzibacteria bacterium]